MSHSAIVSALLFSIKYLKRYVKILDQDNDNDNVMLPAGDLKVGDYVFDAGIGDIDQFAVRCDVNPSPCSLIPSNEAASRDSCLSIRLIGICGMFKNIECRI